MSATARYRAQHEELIQIVGRLTPLLNGDCGQRAKELRQGLNDLAGGLNIHLAMEDTVMYPRLLKASDPTVVKTAQAFIDEMSGLKAAFGAYSKKWTQTAIAADGAGFAAETRAVFAALGERVKKENSQLYPLVDRMG